ncbi:uncharacterized protein LOC101467221 isoform X2 [Maylandia zebra]|uniref:uncharacterized protein LOC101467221 isoform X2 n=1 Tax=Maylandia zebra TaxID=106582 RepID=UPI0006464EF2|nr:histone deacetylase complex subunit SAP25 isoform X2 [Astatotilapia calliptera]
MQSCGSAVVISSSVLHQTPRKTVLPPLSNRTLYHPSFLPLYRAAGLPRHSQENAQTAHPTTPAEFFYTDPTMCCGRRIPNRLSGLKVFDCLQLNTPRPIMSACLAPPNRPDPFRSGPHPTRDLGSPTWRTQTIHPQVQPRQVVLQLTQEEDQAVTNLLKLHYQMDDDSNLSHPCAKDGEEGYKPARGALIEGTVWSDAELEVADTLSSQLKLNYVDLLKAQNRNETANTPPGPLLCPSPQTHQEAEAPLALGSSAVPLKTSPVIKSKVSVFEGFMEAKEQRLSDLEGDAVDVLLSLMDVDITQ